MQKLIIKEKLTIGEQQILDVIQRDFLTYQQFDIEYIASKTFSSTSTISRLIRKLNFSNYSEFKHYLISQKEHANNLSINNNYQLATYISDFFTYYATDYIDSFLKYFDHNDFYLIGIGQSQLATAYFQKSLERFSKTSFCFNDIHSLEKLTAFDRANALFIVFSSSGNTSELVRNVKNLHRFLKGKIILITSNPQAKMIKYADQSIILKSTYFAYQNHKIHSQFVFYLFIDLVFSTYFQKINNSNETI